MVKSPPANAGDIGDVGSIPGLWRSPGGGKGNPRSYSCQGNPMDRGAWRATIHGVTKESDTTEWVSRHTMKLYWNTAHSFPSYLCLLSCFQGRVEQLQQLPHGLQSLKYLISSPVQKTFSDPCCRTGDFLESFSSGKVKLTEKQVFGQWGNWGLEKGCNLPVIDFRFKVRSSWLYNLSSEGGCTMLCGSCELHWPASSFEMQVFSEVLLC